MSTITTKPVFDGGSNTEVQHDGTIMRDESGNWVIMQCHGGWRFVRDATPAEIATAGRLNAEFIANGRKRTSMEVTL